MPACPKPARGSYTLELIEKRAKVRLKIDRKRKLVQQAPGPTATRRAQKQRGIVKAEDIVKDEVKRLDGYLCRWPGCYPSLIGTGLLEAAHFKAEGMGGDPTLARCTVENMLALCRYHHRGPKGLHSGLARMRPLDDALGMRGPVEFSAQVPGEAGKFYVVGVTSPPEQPESKS